MNTFERNKPALRYLSRRLPVLSERSELGIKKIGLSLEVAMLTFFSGTPVSFIFLAEAIRQAFVLVKTQDRREAIISDLRESGVSRARISHLLEGGK